MNRLGADAAGVVTTAGGMPPFSLPPAIRAQLVEQLAMLLLEDEDALESVA